MPAYLGGHRITGARWSGFNALTVTFESSWTGRQTQLYAGRTLVGCTSDTTSREVTGEVIPSEWPQHLTIVSVLAEDRLTDYGATLPDRPYNRVKITVSAASYPADAKRLVLTGGTQAGGAVDDANVMDEVLLSGDGEYTLISPPLEGSGEWNFEVTPYDSRAADGNAGTPLEVSADVIAYPPDVAFDDDGIRIRNVSVASQILTCQAVLP